MNRDFKKVLKGLDGQPMMDGNDEVTLGTICVNALRGTFPGEENLTGVEKEKRYALCKKIYNKGEIDISAEDISLIKLMVGKGYGVEVVGAAYELLES